MELDRRAALRTLRLEQGSAVLEGLAAVWVVFVLFTVLVQSTVLLLAREVAESVVASTARSVASGTPVSSVDLERQLAGTVPGASRVRSAITESGGVVRVRAALAVVPPVFGAVDMVVDAEIPIVVSP